MMRKSVKMIMIAMIALGLMSCATTQEGYYGTQQGAAVGAGLGALGGQIIGRNTGGTLIGAAVGTLVGAIIGNVSDQQHAAARDAARTDKRVVYYDNQGGAVEAFPGPPDQNTNCRKVTKRVWNKGELVSETVEEICEGMKSTRTY